MKRRPHGSERRTGHCLSCGKKYYEEHQELERKLAEFQHKHHLSPDEEVEKKRLQKLKLLGKDKIMEILGRHRQAGAIQ
jgi:uncharacterized protein